jgi:hypothetical protein
MLGSGYIILKLTKTYMPMVIFSYLWVNHDLRRDHRFGLGNCHLDGWAAIGPAHDHYQ